MNYPKSNRLTRSAGAWISKGPGQTGLDADSRVSIDYPPGIAERQLGSIQDMLMYGLKTGTGVADQGLWRCGLGGSIPKAGRPTACGGNRPPHFLHRGTCRPLEDCGWTVSSPPMNPKTGRISLTAGPDKRFNKRWKLGGRMFPLFSSQESFPVPWRRRVKSPVDDL